MQDETNQRLLKSTSEVLQHMLVHEIQHSKELKNSDDCASQLLKQAGGAYMKHVMDIAAETSNMASLQRAGFIVAPGEVKAILCQAANGEISIDDEFADFHGQLVWTMCADRLERGLWLLKGLPWHAMAGLSSDNMMMKIIEWLKGVFEVYEEAMAVDNKSEALQKLLKRHQCNKVSVKQLMASFNDFW